MSEMCPCCEREVIGFVRHHWFDSSHIRHNAIVCTSCNNLLNSWNLGLGFVNHLLPGWETQKEFVMTYHSLKSRGFHRILSYSTSTTNKTKVFLEPVRKKARQEVGMEK